METEAFWNLVDRAKAGDKAAMGELCGAMEETAGSVTNGFVGFTYHDCAATEKADLMQEARIALMEGIMSLDRSRLSDEPAEQMGEMRHFLKVVIYRALIVATNRRHRKKRGGLSPKQPVIYDECIELETRGGFGNTHEMALTNIRLQEVIETIKNRLSPFEAKVLFASALEGMSLKEIAMACGRGEDWKPVANALKRAREKLREDEIAA